MADSLPEVARFQKAVSGFLHWRSDRWHGVDWGELEDLREQSKQVEFFRLEIVAAGEEVYALLIRKGAANLARVVRYFVDDARIGTGEYIEENEYWLATEFRLWTDTANRMTGQTPEASRRRKAETPRDWSDFLRVREWQKILSIPRNKIAAHLRAMKRNGAAKDRPGTRGWKVDLVVLEQAQRDRYREKSVPKHPGTSRSVPSPSDPSASA